MGVFPDFDGLGGIGDLRAVVGALLTFVLIVAVLMLIVSAIVWAIATAHGNYATAGKGRTGVLVSLGAAVLTDRAVALDSCRRRGVPSLLARTAQRAYAS